MRAARTRRFPEGTPAMVYRPSAPVRAPSVVPTTLIETLATGAPATRSVTVPVMRPVADCAASGNPMSASPRVMRARVSNLFIRDLLEDVAAVPRPVLFVQRTKLTHQTDLRYHRII